MNSEVGGRRAGGGGGERVGGATRSSDRCRSVLGDTATTLASTASCEPWASTTYASARGRLCAAAASATRACVAPGGARAVTRLTLQNAVPPLGVVKENVPSMMKRKREMSRAPSGSSWIAKLWPSICHA